MTEHRLSPWWIAIAQIVMGMSLFVFNELNPLLPQHSQLLVCVLLLYGTAGTIGLLVYWKRQVGLWFSAFSLVGMVLIGFLGFQSPSLLIFLPVPIILAAALLGLRAATVVTLIQSALLYLARVSGIGIGTDATFVLAILGSWTALGATVALAYPLLTAVASLSQHYAQAQQFLTETRDRTADQDAILGELLHANRQLDLLNERMTTMRGMAEEAQRTKAAFVAKVSHEFRTPLNMIIGLTDLLLEKPGVYGENLPPTLLEDLRIVHRNCEHLSSMVNDVLDLSQTEAGRLALHKTWVDLGGMLDAAVEVVRPLTDKKQLYLQVVRPPTLPAVFCDQTRIRQVVLNLLSNAARYTDSGGVTLTLAQQDQHLVVSVSDTGSGITDEDKTRLFEPFFQGANAQRNGMGSSTGLGLSISKQFVELHDGELWLESKLGIGSTFYFKIPLAPPSPPTPTPRQWLNEDWLWLERPARPTLPSLPKRPRVVICDEAGELPAALAHYADKIEFVPMGDVVQAAQDLKSSPAHALVFNSPTSEEINATLEQVRTWVRDTPIMICAMPSPIRQALDAGALDYLMKPLTRADLRAALTAVGKPVRRVLTVDDDADFQQLLVRMLGKHDDTMQVLTASDGEQALQMMREHVPDLVLLDIVLPRLNGWQVLAEIQRDPALQTIPVIVVSSQDPADHPLTSKMLSVTLGDGLSPDQLLRCTLALSQALLMPAEHLI